MLCPQSLRQGEKPTLLVISDSAAELALESLLRRSRPERLLPPLPAKVLVCLPHLLPEACCSSSQSLKGVVGATFVPSGARSVQYHFPSVKWMLNERL